MVIAYTVTVYCSSWSRSISNNKYNFLTYWECDIVTTNAENTLCLLLHIHSSIYSCAKRANRAGGSWENTNTQQMNGFIFARQIHNVMGYLVQTTVFCIQVSFHQTQMLRSLLIVWRCMYILMYKGDKYCMWGNSVPVMGLHRNSSKNNSWFIVIETDLWKVTNSTMLDEVSTCYRFSSKSSILYFWH